MCACFWCFFSSLFDTTPLVFLKFYLLFFNIYKRNYFKDILYKIVNTEWKEYIFYAEILFKIYVHINYKYFFQTAYINYGVTLN